MFHHRALVKVFAIATPSGAERTKFLELLRALSRTSLAIQTPGRRQRATTVSASRVLASGPETELALVLVIARLLSGVDTLAAVGRKLPSDGTLATDAALRVLTESVDAKSDFFEALVHVDALVAFGGKSVTFRTLTEVTSGYVLTFSWKHLIIQIIIFCILFV
jgi:hypothetical protein